MKRAKKRIKKRIKKRANIGRIIDSANKAFDVYIWPLFLLVLGIVAIALSLTSSIPSPSELSEVRGHLESYYHKQRGPRPDDYTTIVILEEGTRFWTNAVDKDTAAKFFSRRGVDVRFYIEMNSNDGNFVGSAPSTNDATANTFDALRICYVIAN